MIGRKRRYRSRVPCPECKKGKLILRKGRYGPFYGCTQYPHCRYKQKHSEVDGENEVIQFLEWTKKNGFYKKNGI